MDVDGAISHARALLLTFQLKTNLKEIILNSWDRQFHNIVSCAIEFLYYKVYTFWLYFHNYFDSCCWFNNSNSEIRFNILR